MSPFPKCQKYTLISIEPGECSKTRIVTVSFSITLPILLPTHFAKYPNEMTGTNASKQIADDLLLHAVARYRAS